MSRLARHDHPVSAPDDGIEAAVHGAHALAGVLRGVVHEGQVVHGDHERRRSSARDETGGVGHVDLTGHRLDLRPVEARPRLVQHRSGERQHRHRSAGSELGHRRDGMLAGDQMELDVVGSSRQLAGDAQRRDRCAAGARVPALLDGVGDADRTPTGVRRTQHGGPIMAAAAQSARSSLGDDTSMRSVLAWTVRTQTHRSVMTPAATAASR